MYKKLSPSVVTLFTTEVVVSSGGIRTREALGSGVLIDKEGLIITAAHVVHTADNIMVSFSNGQTIAAEVISSVTSADVALLKLKEKPLNAVVAGFGNSDEVMIGEQTLIIGAPFGLERSLSIGHISGRMTRNTVSGGELMEFLQTDAAINHGNSGGPMFNNKGELIGIVSFILSEGGGFDGIGFAAAINPTKKMLLENPPFWTGFEGIFLTNELAKVFNVPQKSGVLVQRVVSNSLADDAGLRAGKFKATFFGREIWVGGDIILSIQGTSCESPHNFTNIKAEINNLRPGQSFIITVLREGKTIDLHGKM